MKEESAIVKFLYKILRACAAIGVINMSVNIDRIVRSGISQEYVSYYAAGLLLFMFVVVFVD